MTALEVAFMAGSRTAPAILLTGAAVRRRPLGPLPDAPPRVMVRVTLPHAQTQRRQAVAAAVAVSARRGRLTSSVHTSAHAAGGGAGMVAGGGSARSGGGVRNRAARGGRWGRGARGRPAAGRTGGCARLMNRGEPSQTTSLRLRASGSAHAPRRRRNPEPVHARPGHSMFTSRAKDVYPFAYTISVGTKAGSMCSCSPRRTAAMSARANLSCRKRPSTASRCDSPGGSGCSGCRRCASYVSVMCFCGSPVALSRARCAGWRQRACLEVEIVLKRRRCEAEGAVAVAQVGEPPRNANGPRGHECVGVQCAE
jgi:hypothetical protein